MEENDTETAAKSMFAVYFTLSLQTGLGFEIVVEDKPCELSYYTKKIPCDGCRIDVSETAVTY